MSEVRIDEDVVLWSVDGQRVSAQQALLALRHRPLLLLMHGFGSFEGDLIGLAPHLPQGFVCASPRAPLVAPPPIVNGFAWWPLPLSPQGLPLRQPDPELFAGSGPHTAAVALLAWLDRLDEQLRDAPSDDTAAASGLGTVALLGFSQGACLASEFVARNARRYGGLVALSGGLIGPDGIPRDYAGSLAGTPVFLGCSDVDPHIPAERVRHSAEVLAALDAEVDMRLYPGMGHTVNPDEIDRVQAMLSTLVKAG